MKRRTLILGGGALATLSLSVTATNAALVDTISAAADFRVLSYREPRSLTTDPSTEFAESIHTWEVDFSNTDDDIASITADYDFGSETASFNEVSSGDVTVEFEQNGSLTTLTLAADSYSGATATFDITDNDTTCEGRAKITIGVPENGLENPGSGTYEPLLTFENSSGGKIGWEGELPIQANNAGAINIAKPTKDQSFTAVPDGQGNQFEVDSVDIRDNDGDDDITEVNYEVREGGTNGTIVGQESTSFAATATYSPSGTVTIQPNSGYSIQSGQTYTLTTTGQDTDGNYDNETVQDTAGNQSSAVTINKPSSDSAFTASVSNGQFEIDSVDVRDNDGDDDLVEVYYEVHEGDLAGTVVGTRTETFSQTGKYAPSGTQVVQPDGSYSLKNDQLYTLVVQGTDVDENSSSTSVQDTTPTANDPSAISINKPTTSKNFTPDAQQNVFDIGSVQVQDSDNDDDIDEVEYEIYEGSNTSGTLVATKTVTFSQTGKYQPGGKPAETVQPDDSTYNVGNGQDYTLRFTGRDVDENFDTSTITSTA
jgi:hypothetical protein